jgi:hypothetical protein
MAVRIGRAAMPALAVALCAGEALAAPAEPSWAELKGASLPQLRRPLGNLLADSLKLVAFETQGPPRFQSRAFASWFGTASFSSIGYCSVPQIDVAYVPRVNSKLVGSEIVYESNPETAPLVAASITARTRYAIIGEPLKIEETQGTDACRRLDSPDRLFDADTEESAIRATILTSWVREAFAAGNALRWTCDLEGARCGQVLAKLRTGRISEVSSCAAPARESCTAITVTEDEPPGRSLYSVVSFSGPTDATGLSGYRISVSGRVRVID